MLYHFRSFVTYLQSTFPALIILIATNNCLCLLSAYHLSATRLSSLFPTTPICISILLGAFCPSSGLPALLVLLFPPLLYVFLYLVLISKYGKSFLHTTIFIIKNKFSCLGKKFQNGTKGSPLRRLSLNPLPQAPFLMYSWLTVP